MADYVYLVRHGETEWSTARRHTGRTDIPLTDVGRTRAAALAPVLAAVRHIDAATVWTSPLLRASETCELAGCGGRAEVVDELVEWDYGEYEGTRTVDVRITRPGWSIWTDGPQHGETLADVGARCDHLIARLAATEGTAVLFSHAHLLRVLAARWCGFEPIAGRHLTLLPASLSVLAYERETPVIAHWNSAMIPAGGPE